MIAYNPTQQCLLVRGPGTFPIKTELQKLGLMWNPELKAWITTNCSKWMQQQLLHLQDKTRKY